MIRIILFQKMTLNDFLNLIYIYFMGHNFEFIIIINKKKI